MTERPPGLPDRRSAEPGDPRSRAAPPQAEGRAIRTVFIARGCRACVDRININVSAVDYDATRRDLSRALGRLEAMVHAGEDADPGGGYADDPAVMTDSEFAFGWHFFVVSVSRDMVQRLADQMGPDFDRLKGKGLEKKFLSWLESMAAGPSSPRFKLAIKEEMESSKYGVF